VGAELLAEALDLAELLAGDQVGAELLAGESVRDSIQLR